MAYFQKRSGLIGYSAGGSGYTDKLVTECLLYGAPIWGSDAFWKVHHYDAKWNATLETGELRLTPDGTKASVYEVHLHTSTESHATFDEAPDVIIQMKGAGDSSWTTGGDSNGTISVTDSLCTGTGTAWSNTIAVADGITTDYTLPAVYEKSRVYVNGTAGVYTGTTGSKSIAFTTAPTEGDVITSYWTGEPTIKVATGDYIETSEGLHRIVGVDSATQLRLEWYPTTTLTGTHLKAQQLTTGEAETIFGLRGTADRVTFKIYFIPRTHPYSVRFIKDIAISVVFTPAGARQFEE